MRKPIRMLKTRIGMIVLRRLLLIVLIAEEKMLKSRIGVEYSSLIFVCVVYYGRGMEVHNSNDVSVYDAG